MDNFSGRVALVTRANRGTGFEVEARLGFAAVLGARDAEKGERAAAPLPTQ